MNQDIPYQNREIGAPNPLVPTADPDSSIETKSPKLPLNPKIKWLIILGVFIALLLLVSLIISLLKNIPQITSIPTPTPPAFSDLSPTDIPNSAIPTKFRDKFDQIDQNNQTDLNFNPPQIDPNIGQ